MQPFGDPLLYAMLAAITLATIGGGVVFVARAFRGEVLPTPDPLERIVADLFRTAAPPITDERLAPVIDLADTRSARMRTLLADVAEAEALRAGHPSAPRGAHRAQ